MTSKDNYNIAGGDIINQGDIKDGSIGVYKVEQKDLTNEAAKVSQLIEQLSQTYPTETIVQKAVVVEEAIKQIEDDPAWKRKIISAVKSGSLAAFEKAIDNPLAAFLVEGIKGWQEIE